jgi:signal peptidase I
MANKWFAAIIGFFVPPLAFVYLARLRIAALYFLLVIGSGAADYYLGSVIGFSFLGMLLALAAAVHAFILAKTVNFGEDRKWYSCWWGALAIPVVIFSLIFLTRSFVVEPFSIPSESMSPSLEVGDYILVKKLGYGRYGSFGVTLVNEKVENRTPLQRGEIAVILPPHDPRPFVERVIGLPGDVVEFNDKQLKINGELIKTETIGNGVIQEVFGDNISTIKYINDNSR